MPRHRAPRPRFDGAQVRAARLARKWTQEDLAHDLGCSLRTVTRWESGDGGPKGFELLALCKLLELDPDSLYIEDNAAA